MTLEINPEFQAALHIMDQTDYSLFITGKAGTGKSTLLAHFCQITDKQPIILAPTGVAALNVKGQTIHSFFNFYVDVTPQKISEKKSKPRNARLYKKLRMIIIDEVSMVRADLLDCIDVFLRIYGPHPMHPFGGIQMIFIGDLYQLPPVVTRDEKEIFSSYYATPYFFSAHALQTFSLKKIELDKVYRQKDDQFIGLLNKIRNNSINSEDVKLLNSRYLAQPAERLQGRSITLTTTNQCAAEINQQRLHVLPGNSLKSRAVISGDFSKEYFPTETELYYKVDAQVMLLNNDSNKRWVNGSLGIIESVLKNDKGVEFLRIRLQNKLSPVDVYPFTWEVFRFGVEEGAITSETAGTFTQYPIRLAWAITIHKSQGKTFDHVTIDVGHGAFVAGQIYVALSRCTSFDGIILKNVISRENIRTDKRIYEFLSLTSSDEKMNMITEAIRENEYLDIVYLQGNSEKTLRTIRPLTLGEETFKGKNFMGIKAFCVLRQQERLFSLERILKVKKTSGGDACGYH